MDNLLHTLSLYGQYPSAYIPFISVLGLLIGSFLNVVIYRLPVMMENSLQEALQLANGESAPCPQADFNLSVPASTCPKCDHKITALENIPVVSYILLKGKCRNCHVTISPRYPLVELFTALLFFTCAVQLGWSHEMLGACFVSAILVALSGIDFDHKLLPDSLTYALLWGGLIFSLFSSRLSPDEAILGATAGYVSLWSLYQVHRKLTGREGMGHGDFKLFAALGAWVGWQGLPLVALTAALAGLFFGMVTFAIKNETLRTTLPFGPCLALGGWIILLWQSHIENGLQKMLFG